MLLNAFQPQGTTVAIGTTAGQALTTGGAGGGAFRIRNLSSSAQYFSWGGAQVSAPSGPGANTIGMLPNSVETFVLPVTTFFIAQTAAGFEVTPGEGL